MKKALSHVVDRAFEIISRVESAFRNPRSSACGGKE